MSDVLITIGIVCAFVLTLPAIFLWFFFVSWWSGQDPIDPDHRYH